MSGNGSIQESAYPVQSEGIDSSFLNSPPRERKKDLLPQYILDASGIPDLGDAAGVKGNELSLRLSNALYDKEECMWIDCLQAFNKLKYDGCSGIRFSTSDISKEYPGLSQSELRGLLVLREGARVISNLDFKDINQADILFAVKLIVCVLTQVLRYENLSNLERFSILKDSLGIMLENEISSSLSGELADVSAILRHTHASLREKENMLKSLSLGDKSISFLFLKDISPDTLEIFLAKHFILLLAFLVKIAREPGVEEDRIRKNVMDFIFCLASSAPTSIATLMEDNSLPAQTRYYAAELLLANKDYQEPALDLIEDWILKNAPEHEGINLHMIHVLSAGMFSFKTGLYEKRILQIFHHLPYSKLKEAIAVLLIKSNSESSELGLKYLESTVKDQSLSRFLAIKSFILLHELSPSRFSQLCIELCSSQIRSRFISSYFSTVADGLMKDAMARAFVESNSDLSSRGILHVKEIGLKDSADISRREAALLWLSIYSPDLFSAMIRLISSKNESVGTKLLFSMLESNIALNDKLTISSCLIEQNTQHKTSAISFLKNCALSLGELVQARKDILLNLSNWDMLTFRSVCESLDIDNDYDYLLLNNLFSEVSLFRLKHFLATKMVNHEKSSALTIEYWRSQALSFDVPFSERRESLEALSQYKVSEYKEACSIIAKRTGESAELLSYIVSRSYS